LLIYSMAFRTKKISQMDPKGANLASTDLLEISQLVSGSYVTKSITGAEIVASVPPSVTAWGTITGTLSSQTDLNTALSGKVPTTRTLTINGTTQDLSADRTFTISTGITIGTTAITSGTVGRVLFEGTGNVVQESANLFWDNTNGRLGIGGTPSTFSLDVVGTARVQTSLQVGATTTWDVGAGLLSVVNGATDSPILSLKNTDANKQVYYASYNNLNKSLQYIVYGSTVAGTILGQNRANAAIVLGYNTPSVLAIGNYENVPLVLGTNNAERLKIHGNGNVGINTTTDAGYKLDLNGTARVSGNTVVTSWIGVGGVTTPSGTGEKFNVQGAQVISGSGGAGNFLLYQISGASRFIVGSEASIGGTANNYINYVYGNNSHITYTNNVARLSVTGGGNVLIGTTTDIASSKLTIESTTQGFLPPRMTTTQKNAIATPATGLQIYDNTLNRPCFYDGTSWITL
jgi:hypothetical protein